MKCGENSTPRNKTSHLHLEETGNWRVEANVGGLKGDKEAVYAKQELVSNLQKASSISLFYGFKEPPLMLP